MTLLSLSVYDLDLGGLLTEMHPLVKNVSLNIHEHSLKDFNLAHPIRTEVHVL